MNWLALVAIAISCDATRIFIDNYTSDVYFKKIGAVSQKLFYGYVYILLAIVILLCTGFNFFTTDYTVIGLILLSGALVGVAGIPYYKALEIEDSTDLGIFIQLAPILYLILGWFFLNDTFSPLQLIAFSIILLAPFIIILTTRRRSRKTKLKAVFYIFIYVLVSVIGNLIFVKANTDTIPFVDEIAFLFLGKGLANILVVYSRPKWRKRFKKILKSSHHKVLWPLTFTIAINSVHSFVYRLALIAAPTVALASAVIDSSVPIAIFFMGIVLTLIWPKFGREKLDRKTVIVHLVATILVVTGIILLQI
ncbi:EamA family transporter [Candidatus Saccharibacteria bacterium]|nr:EamA family transporter [Candidatus Saccharibacteria bacterium]